MSRYAEMETLLQNLQTRLQGPTDPTPAVVAEPPSTLLAPLESYGDGVERLTRLWREAQGLRESLLQRDGASGLSDAEYDDLQSLLSRVLHELRACEASLQRVSPTD